MDTATRRLHLIDVENLIGERHAVASGAEVHEVIHRWLQHVGWRPGDHVVLACHPSLGLAAGTAVKGGQLVVAPGENGADIALLNWAPLDHISSRFGRVVIGSGDGIFTMFARSLRQRGVGVHACTRQGSMSRSLRRAIEDGSSRPSANPSELPAGMEIAVERSA